MTGARSGSLIAATWLIGLGIIFLIQRFAELSWGQAWPLFAVLIGVSGLVSAVIRGRFDASGIWAFTWPIAWIVIGVLLLMSTTGAIGRGPAELIAEYWPWALIVLGIWFVIGAFVPAGRSLAETLAIPLPATPDAGVHIRFGAGNLEVRAAGAGYLVDGTFEGGVMHRATGPGRLELGQDTRYGLPWLERTSRWRVGLTGEIPLDLRVDAGASRSILDLGDLRVRTLELQTGASETRVIVPRAAGATTIRAQTGAASLTIEIPTGVAARIRMKMALGSTQVDQTRFPAGGAGYESPEYATAANRVDIDVQGGVGSLRVVSGTSGGA